MKRKVMAIGLTMAMAVAGMCGCGKAADSGTSNDTVYKVGIVQYVDDASLNQIEKAIQAELDAKGVEYGVTFDYQDYTFNGQADQSILMQIAADLIADEVDIIIPIATPTAKSSGRLSNTALPTLFIITRSAWRIVPSPRIFPK